MHKKQRSNGKECSESEIRVIDIKNSKKYIRINRIEGTIRLINIKVKRCILC